jgi:hypothetical protein
VREQTGTFQGFSTRTFGDRTSRPQLVALAAFEFMELAAEVAIWSKGPMTTIEHASRIFGEAGLLDRERIIAKAGFNRWLAPRRRYASICALGWRTASVCSGFHCHKRSAVRSLKFART